MFCNTELLSVSGSIESAHARLWDSSTGRLVWDLVLSENLPSSTEFNTADVIWLKESSAPDFVILGPDAMTVTRVNKKTGLKVWQKEYSPKNEK
jgi:outer membrane protein assembly factor BamB